MYVDQLRRHVNKKAKLAKPTTETKIDKNGFWKLLTTLLTM